MLQNNSSMDQNTVCLDISSKKLRTSTNYAKCLKCQASKSEKLSKATLEGVKTFYAAAVVRQDETYMRLKPDTHFLLAGDICVCWHPNCYKSYTSKKKLEKFKDSYPASTLLKLCSVMHYPELHKLLHQLYIWICASYVNKSNTKGPKSFVRSEVMMANKLCGVL